LPTPIQRGQAPQQVGDIAVKTNLRSEYVAGGNYLYQPSPYLRSLPQHIDDLTAQFGTDLYERMLDDSKVTSSNNWLKLSVMAQGMRLVATVDDEQEEGYDQAQEIRDFCWDNLMRVSPSIYRVCYSLLDAIADGYKVAEQTYEYVTEPGYGVRTYLKTIKTKPRNVTAFVVDSFLNIKGLLGVVPGSTSGSIMTQGLLGFTPDSKFSPSNLLPRNRFVIFSHKPKNMDPRGTSDLRAAYTPWWLKQQTIYEYTKYLARFGSPGILGFTAPGANKQVYTDQFGNPLLDANNNPVYLSPEQVMLEGLLGYQGGTAAVFPNGAEVTIAKAEGNGEAFTDALIYADKQIDMALTSQTLASGEAQHQTGIATSTHQDIGDMVVAYTKQELADCIKSDCLYVLVAMNYGEDAARKFTPDISLSEMPQQDFSTNAASVAQLWSAGYLDPSQQPGLDAKLNLPERSVQSIEEAGQEQGQGAGDGANGITDETKPVQDQPQPVKPVAKGQPVVSEKTAVKPDGKQKQPVPGPAQKGKPNA
jgi:hypothetical protein